MATVLQSPTTTDERFVLRDVSWRAYKMLRDELGERPIRLTYDGSDLEIMSPSPFHEYAKSLIARMIDMLSWELDIRIRSGGNTTFRSELLRKGLEPDVCYWVRHADQIRGRRDIDLESDPPPDLAVEVEISRSALDRLSIYAALRVPELWRYDGESLRASVLGKDGDYHESETSLNFPFLRVADLAQFLVADDELDETDRLRAFVAWIHEQGFPKAS